MLRDNKNEARQLTLAERWSQLRVPHWAERYRSNWRDLGLPAKLLMLTAVFVLLAEVLIFLPSISTFRVDWLNERLTAAQLATLAAEGFPGGDVPSGLRAEMLRTAQVKAIASRRQGVRRLVLPVDPQMTIDAHYDLRQQPEGVWDSIGLRVEQIGDAIAVFPRHHGRPASERDGRDEEAEHEQGDGVGLEVAEAAVQQGREEDAPQPSSGCGADAEAVEVAALRGVDDLAHPQQGDEAEAERARAHPPDRRVVAWSCAWSSQHDRPATSAAPLRIGSRLRWFATMPSAAKAIVTSSATATATRARHHRGQRREPGVEHQQPGHPARDPPGLQQRHGDQHLPHREHRHPAVERAPPAGVARPGRRRRPRAAPAHDQRA